MNRWKQLLIVSPFLLTIVLIIVWFYVLDKGDVRIQTNVENTTVDSEGKTISCVKKQCLLTLKTGPRILTIKKNGYHSATKAVGIERSKTTELNVVLLKIAQLVEVANGPNIKEAPPKTIFLDPKDDRVKIQEKDGAKIITSLINIKGDLAFYTSPNREWTFGKNGNDGYIINIVKGSRQKKPLPETAYNLHWTPDSTGILYNNESKQVFALSLEGKIRPLSAAIDLSQIAWIDAERFVYAATENGMTSINTFDISSSTTEKLVEKANFLINAIQWDESQKTTYFHENKEKKWYRLEL